MTNKILIPIDSSEVALEVLKYGADLAQKLNSTVIALHVIEPYSKNPTILSQFKAEMVKHTDELFEAVGKEVVAHAQSAMQGASVPISYQIRMGNAAEQILAAAKELDCSMIVIGSRGMNAVAEFILGSVSSKVSMYAETPVLIVKK